MDGVPHLTQAPIAPGASFDYRFTAPDAGTFWYHPHGTASEQLDRGLYGLLIVDEPEPVEVDRDIALVLDDWRLDPPAASTKASAICTTPPWPAATATCSRSMPRATSKSRAHQRTRAAAACQCRQRPRDAGAHRRSRRHGDGDRRPTGRAVSRWSARASCCRRARATISSRRHRAPGSSSEILVDIGDREIPVARLVYEPASRSVRHRCRRPRALPAKSASGADGLPQRARAWTSPSRAA